MKIKILDFERVARCYKPYVDGIKNLENKADNHRTDLGDLQKEAEGILKQEETLTLDDATKQANQQKIQRLQQEAMLKDKTFKMETDDAQRKLVTDAYKGITEAVEKLASDEDDIIVLNRSEVVYFKNGHDMTDTVIESLKTEDLYTEERLRDPNEQ